MLYGLTESVGFQVRNKVLKIEKASGYSTNIFPFFFPLSLAKNFLGVASFIIYNLCIMTTDYTLRVKMQ